MIYWEYEEHSQENYDAIMKAHAPLGGNCAMATAAHTWDGQLPYLDYILDTNIPALKASIDNDLPMAFTTAWTGAEYPASDFFWVLPTLAVFAQYSYEGADTSYEGIHEHLKNCTGMDMDILKPMNVYHSEEKFLFYYGEKYLFCPTMINTIGLTNNPCNEFREAADEVRKYKSDRWGMLYDFCADVLDTVSIKCELLNKLQISYKSDDRTYLEKAANELVPKLIDNLCLLRERKQSRWLQVQKPFGFDRINYLYGGAIADAKYAKMRLDSYLDGTIEVIEELEEEIHHYEYADKNHDYRFI